MRAYRFGFRALDRVAFPAGKAGNTFRGVLGMGIERERREGGPSGLADPPRPFVLRAWHLDGCTIEPGGEFEIGIHEFDMARPGRAEFERAFERLKTEGLGATRGRVVLIEGDREGEVVRLDLAERVEARRVRVRFETPIELKGAPEGEIPFGVLLARVRDRIATLSSLYGGGLAGVDYAPMGERAASVRTVRSELAHREVERRSSRTGQTHWIGGLTGWAEYEGEVGEFVPWLRAAWWTGVGRHTVWGNGVIGIEIVQ